MLQLPHAASRKNDRHRRYHRLTIRAPFDNNWRIFFRRTLTKANGIGRIRVEWLEENMNSIGPIIGASAAAAAAQRRMEEEERMTTYGPDDLQNDWEFKIVRANQGAFRNQANLTKLVDEEKQAGWVLLEKFDDSRIRFKRQRSMQAHDLQLRSQGIDPYRTQYGTFLNRNLTMVIAAIAGLLVLGVAIWIFFSLSVTP
jgi:hypothetical protein